MSDTGDRHNPPAFNVPPAILVLGAFLIAIHAVMTWASDELYRNAMLLFSFIPITYTVPRSELLEPAALYWSPVTYAFLHGDWMHLGVNAIWLLAFGSAVARRFGNARFVIFMIVGALAGAGFHYYFHPASNIPVIGASAAISACMGAAIRFAIRPGGVTPDVVNTPALSLIESLKNRSIMIFVVIWFAINWVAGTGLLTPGDAGIAWEAHMGGFLIGWLGFGVFDPARPV
ncbi:MAG: rhomboid family intramembrane serine protease [Rhizobiaceae bacterium]